VHKGFFFETEANLFNLLIMKQRIAQLIYEKLSETDTNTPKRTTRRSRNANTHLGTRQTFATHETATLIIEKRYRDLDENTSIKALGNTKPQNDPKQPEKQKSVHQTAVFPMVPLFLSLHLSDFSFQMLVRGQ
jgi:hypothetical protein